MAIPLSDLTKMKTSELASCLRELVLELDYEDPNLDTALEIIDEIERRSYRAEAVYREFQA